jgi:hypothetical protein
VKVDLEEQMSRFSRNDGDEDEEQLSYEGMV